MAVGDSLLVVPVVLVVCVVVEILQVVVLWLLVVLWLVVPGAWRAFCSCRCHREGWQQSGGFFMRTVIPCPLGFEEKTG